ncbi:cholesterol 7-desaturase nvd isoform X2 [Pieris brassicae]|nr:cholesterol 7-desaturase nvd isoform X2 [Pieris brassicae]XP_045526450.1 cholesterol 7-desaturase nvd isoform X2 [Pieris brassicae]XP_045526451.1 cholesterol 7-desaturase nvd isoform X2 [Pieris brassicae]XP_045526452.1 cholesterol 7-desaturase nvd isoform X2 [Pieris brassicae]XP_045526453.1 cholesterol 7-desaturase nvd isoform X2 [Pieris brassicae]
MADTHEIQIENAQCQIHKWNSEEVFLFLINLTCRLGFALFDIIYKHSNVILLCIILLAVVYGLYKSYWSPLLLIRELTHTGFDHIPYIKGRDRVLHIARSQRNRQVGEKVPPPYPNGWFALAESRDLTVGKVLPVDALGENFCLYRGEDSVARIVDAYCPHLGANLGVEGSVKGNCIECPFHHWRFGENGACTYIPDVKNIPKGISIKKWDCMEMDGAVWVWYDAEGRSPMWTVPPLPELSLWGYRGRNEFLISSHIRDIPENAADAAHLNCIHQLSFMTNIGKHLPFLNNIIGHHIWETDWTKTDESHIAQMSIDQNYMILKCNAFPFDLRVKQIGPAHVRLHFNCIFGEAYVIQSVTPVGPMLQKVVHRIYSPTYNAIFGAILVLAEAYQFERDVVVWNNKTHVSSPPYVKADKSIRAFRDWFAQFYSEKSVSMRDAMQNPLDW